MELHTPVELIDTILEDATQKMAALKHALAAKAIAKEESQHADYGPLSHQEEEALKYEQALWDKVCTGLSEIRTLLEEVEQYERQRGLSQ